jgi:23S rRNA (uracil1939-C5)-methyltransferase
MTKASHPVRDRVRIEQVVFPGRSLARREGKVLFTDEGLPGEQVEVEIIKDRNDFSEGRTVSVLEPSALRREPRCEHYKTCGIYQVMDYGFQVEIKRKQLGDILGSRLGLGPEVWTTHPSPRPWGYRNRARFHLLGKPGGLTLAYNQPGSRRNYVSVRACSLVSDRMNELLNAALRILNASRTEAVRDIEVRETASGSELLLILMGSGRGADVSPPSLVPELKNRFPLRGVVWLSEGRSRISETIIHGLGYINEEVGGLRYRLGARSFFQVNRFLLPDALTEVKRAAAEAGVRRIADLYCGVGTFGLALAIGAEDVQGVEPDPLNTAFLLENVGRNRLTNVTVRAGTAEEWIGRILSEKPDLVMVDPPRRGLGRSVIGALVQSPPPRLLYMSCDPATLARDLKTLLKVYALARAAVFDFFPQTPHIETLCVLDRR